MSLKAGKDKTTSSSDVSTLEGEKVKGAGESGGNERKPFEDTNPLNRYYKDWSERMNTWKELQREYM